MNRCTSTNTTTARLATADSNPAVCTASRPLRVSAGQHPGAAGASEQLSVAHRLQFHLCWLGFDDGTYAGCRLVEILSRHPDPGAVLDALPDSFSTPELNVRCEEGEPHRIAAEVVRKADFPGAQVCTIDGLRVDWPDGFGLLRFEGHTPEAMQRIERDMSTLLRSVKPQASVAGGSWCSLKPDL